MYFSIVIRLVLFSTPAVVPDSPQIVNTQVVGHQMNVSIMPPSTWPTPHSFFSLEHEIEYVHRDDGRVNTTWIWITALSFRVVSSSFCCVLLSDCGFCLTSDRTLYVISDPEEDQQAEGPLQRSAGALPLESVDSMEKCNPLKFSDPNSFSFYALYALACFTCLQCHLVYFRKEYGDVPFCLHINHEAPIKGWILTETIDLKILYWEGECYQIWQFQCRSI